MASKSWTNADLRKAVMASTSWRETIRRLGLKGTNFTYFKSKAENAAIDYSHFRGNRSWSEAELRQAVVESRNIATVATWLDLSQGGGTYQLLSREITKLKLDTSHFVIPTIKEAMAEDWAKATGAEPQPQHLRDAAPSLTSGWLLARGWEVAIPLEPCAYDLLATSPSGQILRVQVKSTQKENGTFEVLRRHHSNTTQKRTHAPYTSKDIDALFIFWGYHSAYFLPFTTFEKRICFSPKVWDEYKVSLP
jgi:hypothetical protein